MSRHGGNNSEAQQASSSVSHRPLPVASANACENDGPGTVRILDRLTRLFQWLAMTERVGFEPTRTL